MDIPEEPSGIQVKTINKEPSIPSIDEDSTVKSLKEETQRKDKPQKTFSFKRSMKPKVKSRSDGIYTQSIITRKVTLDIKNVGRLLKQN